MKSVIYSIGIAVTLVSAASLTLRSVAAEDCQNMAATGTGSVSTTPTTTKCTNNEPCGYVATYNPPNPAQQQCIIMSCKCCVWQSQQPYTQPFSCQPDPQSPGDTKCTAGARLYFGQPGFVRITVNCQGGQGGCDECAQTPDFFAVE
ncbi:MAG: hypothetical protein AB7T63_08005 [Planctomycetota bacterium]